MVTQQEIRSIQDSSQLRDMRIRQQNLQRLRQQVQQQQSNNFQVPQATSSNQRVQDYLNDPNPSTFFHLKNSEKRLVRFLNSNDRAALLAQIRSTPGYENTGGFSSMTGQEQVVTPQGQKVATIGRYNDFGGQSREIPSVTIQQSVRNIAQEQNRTIPINQSSNAVERVRNFVRNTNPIKYEQQAIEGVVIQPIQRLKEARAQIPSNRPVAKAADIFTLSSLQGVPSLVEYGLGKFSPNEKPLNQLSNEPNIQFDPLGDLFGLSYPTTISEKQARIIGDVGFVSAFAIPEALKIGKTSTRPIVKNLVFSEFPEQAVNEASQGSLTLFDRTKSMRVNTPVGSVTKTPYASTLLELASGSKAQVTSPYREFFNLEPYDKSFGIKKLVKAGYSPSEAISLLRTKNPRAVRTTVSGSIIEDGSNPATIIGQEKSQSVRTPVFSRNGQDFMMTLNKRTQFNRFVGALEEGKVPKSLAQYGDEFISGKKRNEYLGQAYGNNPPPAPVNKRGKLFSESNLAIASKAIESGQVPLRFSIEPTSRSLIMSNIQPYEIYRVTTRETGTLPKVKASIGQGRTIILGDQEPITFSDNSVSINEQALRNIRQQQAEARLAQRYANRPQMSNKRVAQLLAQANPKPKLIELPKVPQDRTFVKAMTGKAQVIPSPISSAIESIQSPYAGQGTYEKTEFVTGFKGSPQLNNMERLSNQQKTLQTPLTGITEKVNLGNKIIDIEKFSQPQKEAQIETQGQNQRVSQSQIETQLQRFVQSQRQRTNNPKNPGRPSTDIIRPKGKRKNSSIGGLDIFGSNLEKAYDVFIGRGKKEKRIGKGLPIGLATELGVKRNLADISASFRLAESGTTSLKDINFTAPESMFRPSKRVKGSTIQRREKRLSSRSEVKDIKLFKKLKKGNLSWF